MLFVSSFSHISHLLCTAAGLLTSFSFTTPFLSVQYRWLFAHESETVLNSHVHTALQSLHGRGSCAICHFMLTCIILYSFWASLTVALSNCCHFWQTALRILWLATALMPFSHRVLQGRSHAYVGLARRGAVFLHFFVHVINNLLGSDELSCLSLFKVDSLHTSSFILVGTSSLPRAECNVSMVVAPK